MFQVLGRHMAKAPVLDSTVIRSPCEIPLWEWKELLSLQGILLRGAVWFRRTLLCLISLALPLMSLDYNPQPVASVRKDNKTCPFNTPIKFTPGTWVSQLLFLLVSRDTPGEIEIVSLTCISTPFLHSLQQNTTEYPPLLWLWELKWVHLRKALRSLSG